MRVVRKLLLIGLAVLALGLAACGDDDDEETTPAAESTELTVEEAPATTTDTVEDETAGEVADLPICDETGSVRPCRTEDGAVLEEGGGNAGEVSDLPLCSEAEPPCRNPDGSFVEP